MTAAASGRIVVGVGCSLGGYQALRYAVEEARRRDAPILAVRTYWISPHAQGYVDPRMLARAATFRIDEAFAAALGGWRDMSTEPLPRRGRRHSHRPHHRVRPRKEF